MKIQPNTVVSFHYTLTNDEGVQIDASSENEPLFYLHGSQQIIPGLQQQLEGKEKGDSFTATIEADMAYGEHMKELVQQVPLEAFGENQVEVGSQFTASTDQGQQIPVRITAKTDTHAEVDANHPLAGQRLHFDVTVEEIREASKEEIDHGHVHGPGGHQH